MANRWSVSEASPKPWKWLQGLPSIQALLTSFLMTHILRLMATPTISVSRSADRQGSWTSQAMRGDLTKMPSLGGLLVEWYVVSFLIKIRSLTADPRSWKINGRISIFRGQTKRNAASRVEGHYHLFSGHFTAESVKSLLQFSNYIYLTKKVSVSLQSEQPG